jgi:hypothetical protein
MPSAGVDSTVCSIPASHSDAAPAEFGALHVHHGNLPRPELERF